MSSSAPQCADFAGPLADLSRARLELPGGAYHLRLRPAEPRVGGDPYRDPPELFRAHFEGAIPEVAVHDGTVRIVYPRFRFFGPRGRDVAGEIALAPSVPWTIALAGGAAQLDGDLRRLDLEGIEIRGGLSVVRLVLPRPTRPVTITISGGVNRLELLRPAVTPLRLRATGGIHDLRVDELALSALGGPFDWESPGASDEAGRYDVHLAGGVNGLRVARQERPAGPGGGAGPHDSAASAPGSSPAPVA
jgi:hypothetical protein